MITLLSTDVPLVVVLLLCAIAFTAGHIHGYFKCHKDWLKKAKGLIEEEPRA